MIGLVERLFLKRHGWKESHSIRGIEQCWLSPSGVRAVDTELGVVICLQHEAAYIQRRLLLGLGPKTSVP